jgi:Ca2+-binding RTX toxin-like protein
MWLITGFDTGTVGDVHFELFDNLTGGTKVDSFQFQDGGSVTGTIDGGGGGDWLDYSAYSGMVDVDLKAGTATGVTGSVKNIQNVRAGDGGDTLTGSPMGSILIGGTGTNKIQSGGGRSILISGEGSGTVKGTRADDILIGGTTTYDSGNLINDAALARILAEWQSKEPFKARKIHIEKGGGLNGTNVLAKGSTVHVGGGKHTLHGGGGSDLFFK